MFYKHNDSVKRRTMLGIGEALLGTCAFAILNFLPPIAFIIFRSNEPSSIQDFAPFLAMWIAYGFFFFAVYLPVIIPFGALLGFLLPRIAHKYKLAQAFLSGRIGGALLVLAAMTLMVLPSVAQPVTALRSWLTVSYSGPLVVIWCALDRIPACVS